jgi:hypothetical protein
MPLDEYYKIKFTKMMLVNSVQLGSYDNKCLNAKLYFTPPRHESSHDSRYLNAFLMLMVRFNFITGLLISWGFLCCLASFVLGHMVKKYICVLFSYVTKDALCDALGNCRKVLQSSVNFTNIFVLVWILKPICNSIFHRIKLINAYIL